MSNPIELMEMLEKIYPGGTSQDAYLTKLEQKLTAQKDYINKLKTENDAFFNFIYSLFEQRLNAESLRKEINEAANQYGFENVEQALNQIQNRYGQTLLQKAFQQQNFAMAKQLMDLGAEVGPIERAAFEVALDSVSAKKFGFSPSEVEHFHPVKNFGLVLGIEMTSADGTYSQIAHIAPTYRLMTNFVNQYANNNPQRQNFKEIAEALSFTNNAAKFSHSTSKDNPWAGEVMANRISQGKLTTIPLSCQGHFMGLSVVPDGPGSKSGYLVFTNRGIGCEEAGTQIYRINDLSKINGQFINTAMNGHSQQRSHAHMMGLLNQVTEGPPIYTIKQKAQKHDNCSIANSRSNMQGILLCQKAITKHGFDNLSQQDINDVKTEYKNFTHAMRAEKVNELAMEIAKNPKDPDLINLAKEYLKQHPRAEIELRNKLTTALEKANAEEGHTWTARRSMS